MATAHANGTTVLLRTEYTEVGTNQQTCSHEYITHSSQAREVVQRDNRHVIHVCDVIHQRCVPETVLLK